MNTFCKIYECIYAVPELPITIKKDRIHPVIFGSKIISAYGITLIQRHRQVTGRCLNVIKSALRKVFKQEDLYTFGREKAYRNIPYRKNNRTNCRQRQVVRYKFCGICGNTDKLKIHKMSIINEGIHINIPCFKFCFQLEK